MQWLITAIALTGAMFNARGKWYGFLFWLISTAWMAVHNLRIGEREQALQYAVFWLFAVHGLIHWRKSEPTYSEKYSPPACDKCGRPKRYGGILWLDHPRCERISNSKPPKARNLRHDPSVCKKDQLVPH